MILPRSGAPAGHGARSVMQGVVAVREFYKFAAAEEFVDGSVLAALYQVADSRHLPAHLSVEGAGLGYVARPRHRVKLARRAGSHDLVRAVARSPTLDPVPRRRRSVQEHPSRSPN